MNLELILREISVWALPILFAITLHEAAHGWVAWRLGDDTAYMLGRVSFNPVRHIDPLGTVILPALLLFASGGRVLFGFAKPVPVDFRRLRRPRRDMVWVAAAGPGINLVMAVVCAVGLHVGVEIGGDLGEWIVANLQNAIWINVLLAVFNMLPVPPLDGGRVAVGLLPPPLAIRLARMERYGFAIVIGGIFLLPWLGRAVGINLEVFEWLVVRPAALVTGAILLLTGVS